MRKRPVLIAIQAPVILSDTINDAGAGRLKVGNHSAGFGDPVGLLTI